MSDNKGKQKIIVGEISDCHLASKDGLWGKYSVKVVGRVQNGGDLVDENFVSQFDVKVYDGENEKPMTEEEKAGVDGKKFNGQVLITEKEYNGKTYKYLNAVCINSQLALDSDYKNYEEFDDTNPFLNSDNL